MIALFRFYESGGFSTIAACNDREVFALVLGMCETLGQAEGWTPDLLATEPGSGGRTIRPDHFVRFNMARITSVEWWTEPGQEAGRG